MDPGKSQEDGPWEAGKEMAPEDGSAQGCGWVKKAEDWDLNVRSNNQEDRGHFNRLYLERGLGEKVDWSKDYESVSLSRVWLFETPRDCSPPGSSAHGIL